MKSKPSKRRRATLSLMLATCLGISWTPAWNIIAADREQAPDTWLEQGEPAPFAGKLLTEEEYRSLIGLLDGGEQYERGWRNCTALLTDTKVALARAQANQRNKVVSTAKDVGLGVLAAIVASRGKCGEPDPDR